MTMKSYRVRIEHIETWEIDVEVEAEDATESEREELAKQQATYRAVQDNAGAVDSSWNATAVPIPI